MMKKSKAKLKEEEAEMAAAAQEDTTALKKGPQMYNSGMSPEKRNWRVCFNPVQGPQPLGGGYVCKNGLASRC